MKIVKESLNENRLKPWHYTEDEIFDVAYNLMMNGYLEGWEAADIKSALLYADGETIGDAPYIFTMDEEDEDDEFDESLNERYSFDLIDSAIEHFYNDLGREPEVDDIIEYIERTSPDEIPEDDIDRYNKWYRDIAAEISARLNESLNENMNNMDKVLDSKEANPVTTFPITMTDAIEKNKEIEKQAEDIKKEQEKVFSNKRYFLGAQNQPTPKEVEEPKQLSLDESLFTESNLYYEPLYKQAETIADELSEFLDLTSRISNEEDYLDENDLEHLGKSIDVLYDFAQMYGQAAGVNEAVKPGTKLGKRKSTLPREKEKREEWDAWTTVMEELVPSDMLYKFKEVSKFPDIRPKARYDANDVSVDYDGNVEIYADSVDKFDFAKKVADAYNLTVDEPRPRTNGNGFTMKIHMPETKDE